MTQIRVPMKRALLKICLLVTSKILAIAGYSQCTTANVNWDNLDYLITTGAYSGFVTAAMSQSQWFMIGKNRVNITFSGAITTVGENVNQTGDAGGADVQYSNLGNIVLTFRDPVENVRFSLLDIDANQRVNVTAAQGATARNVVMTRPAGGNVTITGSGTTNAQGLGGAVNQGNTVTVGNVTIDIAGPVTTVTIAMSNANNEFWLSDISACVYGTFATNYFVDSRPFTNQPTYIIGTSDTNTVSLINVTPATPGFGTAKMIFQDITSPRYINGIAYDHKEHNLYYVIDFTTTPATNKAIKRYDFDTDAQIVLVPNVNTLGIPTFTRGVESAGCAFYDSCLYFGVEGNIGGNNGGRETIIWRIEFDAPGGNAINACQVYATPSDNGGGTVLHDWNDFTIADGLLVDFCGSPVAASRRFTHYDLQTQNIVNNYFSGSLTPRQAGITWDDTRYWVYNQFAIYNMNGTIGALTTITGATPLDWFGFCGDATGFRPKSDFGDAPAIYDPVALSPALHEIDTFLRLGPTWDQEFDKISSINADADGADEDCIATLNVLDTGVTTYLADFTIFNNTGSNVTVVAWLDWDGDNVFEPTEGRTMTVPHGGPVLQARTFSWVGINTPLVPGQATYLRIRVARSGLTVNTPTGYYNNGEVEDYRVFVTTLLPVTLLSFDASVVNGNSVKLDWRSDNEVNLGDYEIQRSTDAINWQTIGAVAARNQSGVQQYTAWDNSPFNGKSYYRLKIMNKNGAVDKYSAIRQVQIKAPRTLSVTVSPNPVVDVLQVNINTNTADKAIIKVADVHGRTLLYVARDVNAGVTTHSFTDIIQWPAGFYYLTLTMGNETITTKFVKVK
jgi:hypothetical protein